MVRRAFGWFAIAAATMLGCGGKVVIDGGGGATSATPCDHACERVVAACGGIDQATCVAGCEQNAEQSQANGCGDVDDQLVSCIANASDEVVCGPGMNVPASCQSLYEQWDACM